MTSKMIIKVPPVEQRTKWAALEDVSAEFSDEVIFEIVCRYFDAQDHAINYRKKSAAKIKTLKALAVEQGWEV